MVCPYKEEALRSPLLYAELRVWLRKAPATVRGRYKCKHI